MISFEEDICQVINRHSGEAPSGTPDYILAKMIKEFLKAYNEAVSARAEWRGEDCELPKGNPDVVEILRESTRVSSLESSVTLNITVTDVDTLDILVQNLENFAMRVARDDSKVKSVSIFTKEGEKKSDPKAGRPLL